MLLDKDRSGLASILPTFWFGNSAICTYCGGIAEGRDHIIPWAYTTNIPPGQYSRGYGPMTWACRSCNSAIGSRYFGEFKSRCEYAKDRIEFHTKPMIWHGYEIAELEYSMKKYVQNDHSKRRWMRNRADWYESRDFLLNIECLLWEPRLDRYSKNFNRMAFDYFESIVDMLQYLNRVRS